MIIIAQCIVVLFGVFLIATGFLMLLAPERARNILRKAGSTNLINYGEITLRLIPAAAMIICADYSSYPLPFTLLGWFMVATSGVLYCIPKTLHHSFSLKSADMLKPLYVQMIAPFSMLFGGAVIYNVI